MKTVPFDHATPPYGEDARRFIEDQRSGTGSKWTNVESNLLLLAGRELHAQHKFATARPHEVLAKLDVPTASEINPGPRVEHKPPNSASAKTVAWLILGGAPRTGQGGM